MSLSRARTAGLAAAGCWLVPVALTAWSGPGTQAGRLAGHAASLLFAPLFIVLASALGDWLLERALRVRSRFTGRWVFAAGLGLGALVLGTLMLGVVVVPSTVCTWGIVVGLAVLLSGRAGKLLCEIGRRLGRRPAFDHWVDALLAAVIVFLLALNLLRAFVPPMEYDEMEYHLAAPARHVRAGRIAFIPDNVYASFPANVEMLFLDAMLLRGGAVQGLALGRLMNVALGLLAAAAAAACAGAMFSKRAAMPAAAILYSWPRINGLALVGYVELGLMLYVGLALLAAWHYHRSGRDRGYVVLLGLACGLAAGCKYPAVLFLCVPSGLALMVLAGRRALLHVLLFGVVALAAFAPWLVRNTVATGNPVYPLLSRTLGGAGWTERKAARWERAHAARGYSMGRMAKAVRDAALQRYPNRSSPHCMSILLVAFLPFAFIRRERRRAAVALLALTVLMVVLWLLFTHRIPRFLVPWLVPLVVLNAAGAVAFYERKALRPMFGVAVALLSLVEAEATYRVRSPRAEMSLLSGAVSVEAALRELKPSQNAVFEVNALPSGSKTLFYGGAETLYCTGDFIAPTVFDENPLDAVVRGARTPEAIRDGLRRLGVTHVYVNLAELHRLQWSYAFEHEGRAWHGYCTLFLAENQAECDALAAFLRRYCRVVYQAPPLVPGARPASQEELDAELLRLMSGHDRTAGPRLPVLFYVYELKSRP